MTLIDDHFFEVKLLLVLFAVVFELLVPLTFLLAPSEVFKANYLRVGIALDFGVF